MTLRVMTAMTPAEMEAVSPGGSLGRRRESSRAIIGRRVLSFALVACGVAVFALLDSNNSPHSTDLVQEDSKLRAVKVYLMFSPLSHAVSRTSSVPLCPWSLCVLRLIANGPEWG